MDETKTETISIYYDLRSYQVTYEFIGNVPAGVTKPASTPKDYLDVVNVPVGEQVVGYTLTIWYVTNNGVEDPDNIVTITGSEPNRQFIMPHRDVTLYAQYTANEIPYEAHHYLEILNNDDVNQYLNNTDRYEVITYNGHTYVWDKEDEHLTDSGTSTVLVPAEETSVNIEGFTLNSTDTIAKIDEENSTSADPYDVTYSSVTVEGKEGLKQTASVLLNEQGTGTRVFKFLYTRDEHPVTYYVVGHIPTEIVDQLQSLLDARNLDNGAAKTYQYNSTVTVEPDMPAVPGYTFTGWETSHSYSPRLEVTNGTFTMPDRSVEFHGRYEKIDDSAPYYINVYKETLDENEADVTKQVDGETKLEKHIV